MIWGHTVEHKNLSKVGRRYKRAGIKKRMKLKVKLGFKKTDATDDFKLGLEK